MIVDRTRRFRRTVYRLIDWLSFNDSIRGLADRLNRTLEQVEDSKPDLLSHPGGFIRAFRKRRMGMAESYIRVAQELDLSDSRKRLHALKTLMALSFHAKTVTMPLNTARIQSELMKKAVKSPHNRRCQMELIADFSIASYGHEAAVRKFLKELKRVEAPENGKALKNLDMGWDAHVHDNVSEGRKTPSQLILDAFIKGISRLTLAYYDIPHRDIIYEAMEGGRIMGIDISIGIEFSIGPRHQRKHFLFIPPARTHEAFLDFFESNSETLTVFIEGLLENRERRSRVITQILKDFNNTHRITLNKGYADDSLFALQPLKFEDLKRIVPYEQYSRNHLSEFLFSRLKPLLKRRTLALQTQCEVSRRLHRLGEMTSWEYERIEDAYIKTRKQYTFLSPADLKERYFSGKKIIDYDSAFLAEEEILPVLWESGGEIVYNRPLEHGLSNAVSTVFSAFRFLDHIELINMRDSIDRDPAEIIRLARFLKCLHSGSPEKMEQFLKDNELLHTHETEKLQKAMDHYQTHPLTSLAVSATTGWKPQAPGMGFIREKRIPPKSRKHFVQTQYRLPRPVTDLIINGPFQPDSGENSFEEIYCLGKRSRFHPNPLGDEEAFEKIGPLRFWRYLNPALKNCLRIGVGLAPAWWWIGPEYTFVWFGITFFRNIFVDLVAFSGFSPRSWSFKDINFDNVAQSLFWTGFSVPILGMAKHGFDIAWPLAAVGLLFEWTKFFIICIANGIYISTHNRIRQFDAKVIRANFFRSILAWPFSAIFAPVGNLIGVPSIVQAKFWSDVVAAMIEGSSKYHQKIVLRHRDLMEILSLIRSRDAETRLTALLDILYIWAVRQRGKSGLSRILSVRRGVWRKAKSALKKKYTRLQEERKYLNDLIEISNPHQNQAELTQFILKNYTEQEMTVLTDLVGQNLVDFHQWVKKLKPLTAAPKKS